jgi:hypothetical protein
MPIRAASPQTRSAQQHYEIDWQGSEITLHLDLDVACVRTSILTSILGCLTNGFARASQASVANGCRPLRPHVTTLIPIFEHAVLRDIFEDELSCVSRNVRTAGSDSRHLQQSCADV